MTGISCQMSWQPRIKAAVPIILQRRHSTFQQPWHPISFDRTLEEDELRNSQHDDFHDDIRNEVDKEVDRLQEFNDKVLWVNGIHMIPYNKIQRHLPSDLYAGSFAAELSQGLFLYVCKACDMAGFLKSNFQLHHNSGKHQENIRVWIRQHYIIPNDFNTLQDHLGIR